jgi:hypothetical protein
MGGGLTVQDAPDSMRKKAANLLAFLPEGFATPLFKTPSVPKILPIK